MLTTQQIKQFKEEGYVLVEGFFNTAEVKAMQAELERFRQEKLAQNVATDDDGKTHSTSQVNLQIKPLHDKSELFKVFPFQQKVKEAVNGLIGEPAGLLFDQIFLKPGKSGAGTSWHTDNAYFKIKERETGVGMWTALHEATVENGTLEIVPKSHLKDYEHERDLGSDHHVTCQPDESKAVHCVLPAGGVVFFNFGIAHCTRRNNSDKARAGLAYHFLNTDAIQPDWCWTESQVVHVTGEKATEGEKEYGQVLTGKWEEEVASLTS